MRLLVIENNVSYQASPRWINLINVLNSLVMQCFFSFDYHNILGMPLLFSGFVDYTVQWRPVFDPYKASCSNVTCP